MPNKKVYIYTLVNPLNNKVFYVGYTNNPTRRLKEHIKRKANPIKTYIIEKILKNGLKPEIVAIDECEYVFNQKEKIFEHEKLEIYYIKKYRDEGIKLANLTKGGDMARFAHIPVYQFDEFGNYLRRYDSLTEASESVMVSISKISQALNQKVNKSSAGFYWFTSMEEAKNIKLGKMVKKNIPILQYSLNAIFIRRFKSQEEAERITGIKSKLINKCLRGSHRQSGGFYWFYENNVPIEINAYGGQYSTKLKPISQYDLNGNLINEFLSVTSAAAHLNVLLNSISTNLKHITKTCGGFIFTYANEKPEKYVDKRKLRIKAVLKFNTDGIFMDEYTSIKEAAKINNVEQTSISANLCNVHKTAGGFIWKYKNN